MLDGSGSAFAALRRVDWDRTLLGPSPAWPSELKSALAGLLRSEAPRALLWGPQFLTFCNNACIDQGCVAADTMGKAYPESEPGRWAILEMPARSALAGMGSVMPEFRAPGPQDLGDITYQLNFSPVFGEGLTPSAVLVDIVDLTARKRREDDLRSEVSLLNELFSTAPVLITYCSGPDLRIEYMNPAFQDLFEGRTLVGLTVAEAVPEAAAQGYVDHIRAVFETGTPWSARELPLPIRTPDNPAGGVHYFDFACHPMRSAAGAISGLMFSGYEVTDRHEAREEGDRLRHQLLHATRMEAMGTMAATIAHELNQPLAAAANYLAAAEYELVGDASAQPGEPPHPLVEARTQLLRAGTIIRRMRSLVECGAASTSAFDLERSIRRAIDLLRAGGHLDGFEIDVDCAPRSSNAIGDDIQIEQVVVNILRNAVEASEANGARRVKFCLKRQEHMIEVMIRDWGPGISSSVLEKLFTTMQQPSSGGLGVGLPLCRTIIEAHGGTISAWNDEVAGAIFRFTLPAADEPCQG